MGAKADCIYLVFDQLTKGIHLHCIFITGQWMYLFIPCIDLQPILHTKVEYNLAGSNTIFLQEQLIFYFLFFKPMALNGGPPSSKKGGHNLYFSSSLIYCMIFFGH